MCFTKFAHKIFNLLFYLQLFLHSVIYVFILFFYLIPPFLFFTQDSYKSRIRNSVRLYGKWILKFALFPYVKVEYNDLAKDGPLPGIFICNHRSASDPYLMALLGIELVQVVNRWPFKIPFYGYFANKAEYISVHDLSFENLHEVSRNLLNRRISIAVFPEGTRSGNNRVGQFNSSFFRIALANKCPIYPVCIIGNEKIPDKKFNIYQGKIRVDKLKPLLWDEYKNMSSFQLKNYIRNIIIEQTLNMESE